ncbi:MAG: hypothetical protein LUI10_01505 [Lachnospiraceae bacterium]|nr:hypothetical protein [Lachnospiraceae bacterium]
MKTTYYLNGKKTSKKSLTEMLCTDHLKQLTNSAKEGFMEDPYEEQDFFLGAIGMLTIQFS